ncbi:MAG: hypothetical protein QOI04_264 [Verrucomicrobiota bacterium]|jgi:hypothetical protein
MSTATPDSLITRIIELESELVKCRVENKLLRSKLGSSAWRIDAEIAEAFVHGLIGGTRTRGSATHDLEAVNGQRLEIKFSNLNTPMPSSTMRRWVWAHVLGRDNAKNFDRLILVAPHDPRYRQQTKDPHSPWIIFDVPYQQVLSLAERDNTIWTGTSASKFRRSTHRRLMCDYQVSQTELKARYTTTS